MWATFYIDNVSNRPNEVYVVDGLSERSTPGLSPLSTLSDLAALPREVVHYFGNCVSGDMSGDLV